MLGLFAFAPVLGTLDPLIWVHHHSLRLFMVIQWIHCLHNEIAAIGGGHRCPFLTPNRNFQAFHLCFRGTSNDWHAEFQSFVMINVRCCLCVLDFKKRQEALQEPLVVLNWWNLVNISMETFCIWSFALPIVSFHDFSICFSPWFLHVSTISTHICVVLQDTLW